MRRSPANPFVQAPPAGRARRLPTSRLRAVAIAIALAALAACPGPGVAAEPATDAPELVLAVLDAVVRFDRYETDLLGASRPAVASLAEELAGLERLVSIRVTGHADSRGPAGDNLVLSRLRAEAVSGALRERWPDVRVLTLAAGESEPVAENVTDAGRALNRRVEVQVIGVERAAPER